MSKESLEGAGGQADDANLIPAREFFYFPLSMTLKRLLADKDIAPHMAIKGNTALEGFITCRVNKNTFGVILTCRVNKTRLV